MDLELAGKVVLITGASGGLGREMAVDFAREDARVVVHYRSGVEAAEVVADTIENMYLTGFNNIPVVAFEHYSSPQMFVCTYYLSEGCCKNRSIRKSFFHPANHLLEAVDL